MNTLKQPSMKKNKTTTKYFGAFLALLISSCMFSQFNTVTPVQPQKKENQILTETKEITNKNIIKKKDKNLWKQIFNVTTKADLKNQIDSLKILIKESSVSNNKNWNMKNSRDSLLLRAQIQLNSLSRNRKADLMDKETYDYVEEPESFSSKINMPLKNIITVTSPYGVRIHPIFRTAKMHNGIDLKANYENVYSVLDGIITERGYDSKGGGNYIKINHFNRFETSYLHLSEIYYRVGEHVKAGFIIAKSGNTGNSTGPHLHFSVKEFGHNINPTGFLNDLVKANNLIAAYYNSGILNNQP